MLSNSLKLLRNLRVLSLIVVLSSTYTNARTNYFNGCDYSYNITAGYSYLESPYYPLYYPPNSSCRYKFMAPRDHDIIINCTISLDKGPNGCTTEHFYLARDGDLYLRDSERFCGSGTLVRRSLFRSIVLAYISDGARGRFRCQFNVRPQQCDCGWSVNTKIVNGEEASVNEYPSVVALRDKTSNMNIYCSASIISYRFMVTAAHCAEMQPNPANIQALVGRHNLQLNPDTKYSAVYYISKILKHPGYKKNPTNNDIAMLKTTKDIEFSKGVGPICLPPPSNINNDFSYNYADVIGWGTMKFSGPLSPTLQKVTLLITDNKSCNASHGDINPTHICTYDSTGGRKDSCQFDSGGPVIFRNNRQILIGVISYGNPCGTAPYALGVNTRVTSYLGWMYDNTESSICIIKL